MSCCWSKKLFGGGRSKREDRYKVKEEEEVKNDGPAEAEAPKYSWDKRPKVDVSDFEIKEVHEKVVKKEGTDGGPMKIDNCTESTLLFLHSTSVVTIDDCRHCTIVLGPTEGSVFVRDCSNCTILTSCGQLRTRDCTSVRIGILCSTEPIVESSNDISFYHLAMYYPELKDQMYSVGLRPFMNRATSAHDFTPAGVSGKGNFKVNASPVELSERAFNLLTTKGVITAPNPNEFIPRISNIQDSDPVYLFILGKAEPANDLGDKGIELLRAAYSADMKVMATYDVITKNLDSKMIPFAGQAERLILFKLSGTLEKLDCDVEFDLISENDSDALQSLLVHLNTKNSG